MRGRLHFCLRNPVTTEKLLHLPTSRTTDGVVSIAQKQFPHFWVVGGDKIILNGVGGDLTNLKCIEHTAHLAVNKERLCLRTKIKP